MNRKRRDLGMRGRRGRGCLFIVEYGCVRGHSVLNLH
jgi:hypothetical protein